MPSSTASPSTWWKTERCVASTASRRYTRPGAMIAIGGWWGRRGAGLNAARRDDRDRRLLGLHGADLNGARLGPKQHPGNVDVERVLHRARRVIGGDVQRLEVVPVVLDLGSLGDAIAHAREHVDDAILDE